MKMKMAMIAALAAAPLPAATSPARADGLPSGPAATRPAESIEAPLRTFPANGEASTLRAGDAPDSARPGAAREDKPRKRRSTSDKVLTGAAVVLGIGALAVGGLLVAIFVG